MLLSFSTADRNQDLPPPAEVHFLTHLNPEVGVEEGVLFLTHLLNPVVGAEEGVLLLTHLNPEVAAEVGAAEVGAVEVGAVEVGAVQVVAVQVVECNRSRTTCRFTPWNVATK